MAGQENVFSAGRRRFVIDAVAADGGYRYTFKPK